MKRLGRHSLSPLRLGAIVVGVVGLFAVGLEAAFCSNANGAAYFGALQAPGTVRLSPLPVAGTRPSGAHNFQQSRSFSFLPFTSMLCAACIGVGLQKGGLSKKSKVRVQALAAAPSCYSISAPNRRMESATQATQLVDSGCNTSSLPTAFSAPLPASTVASAWSELATPAVASAGFAAASSGGEGQRNPRSAKNHKDRQREERRHIGAKLLQGSSGKLEVHQPSFDASKVRPEIQTGLRLAASCTHPRAERNANKRSEKLSPLSNEWGTTSLTVIPPKQ